MADFLRPEARAALWRWREVLAAGALVVLGFWWGTGGHGILRWLGWAVALAGAAAAWAGWQRLRFARGGGGQGVVQIDEARVTYLGPFGGSAVDLGRLRRLELDRDARPAHWWLTPGDGAALAIPVDAEGADRLIDAFAALPGLAPHRLIAALDRAGGRETLWQREPPPADRQLPPRH